MSDLTEKEKIIMAAIQMYKDGMPVGEIAERIDRSRPTVYVWLKKAGVKANRMSKDSTPPPNWEKLKKEINR